MKKFFSIFAITLIFCVVLSSFYSFIVKSSIHQYKVDIESTDKVLSKRTNKVNYAIDLNNINEYNYYWLCLKLDKPSIDCNIENYQRIDSNFYKNNVSSIFLDLQFSSLFNNKLEVQNKKLDNYIHYIKSKKIQILGVSGFSFYPSSFSVKQKIDYVALKTEGVNFLAQQLLITEKIINGTDFKNKEYLNFIIDIAYTVQSNYNINVIGNIIAEAFRKHLQLYPNSKIRLLLKNGLPISSFESQDSCSFEGISTQDLKNMYQVLQRQLAGVPNLSNRIGFALDISNLITIWQSSKCKVYKDKYDNSILDSDFIAKIISDLSQDGKDMLLVKAIFTSYNKLGENLVTSNTIENISHLPYTRATNKVFLQRQLKLFTDLYQVSGIGRNDNSGLIVIDTPMGKMFPMLHTFMFFIIDKFNFYFKKDGADIDEIIYSKELIQQYISTIP